MLHCADVASGRLKYYHEHDGVLAIYSALAAKSASSVFVLCEQVPFKTDHILSPTCVHELLASRPELLGVLLFATRTHPKNAASMFP